MNLTTGYGGGVVLKNVSINVKPGECVGVVGRNGSGKSTLIRTIMGQTKIYAGSVQLDSNLKLSDLKSHEIAGRGIGVLPQGNRVFANLTVQENLRLGSRSANSVEKIKHLLASEFPQLLNKRIQLAGSLSGGERQMLALACLYLADPNIILMDEPTEGLMPALVREVEEKIGHLRSQRKALLLAEQNLELVLRNCDRYYILRDGQITAQGDSPQADRHVLERHLGIGL